MTDKRKFEIVYDTELPGTPERVWEAVTKDTPAWMFPTDQWPAVRTVDEYPSHLVSRMDGPDGWFNQLEHVLEPLDGGRARLHYVHSGIFADNWDEQYDGASKHTAFYLHTLGQYLKYFDGKPVVFTDIQAPAASQTPDGFDRLKKALGVARLGPGGDGGAGARRRRAAHRRSRLLQRELPRPADRGHDVPLLRAQRLRRAGGHDRARLQRQRGRRGDGARPGPGSWRRSTPDPATRILPGDAHALRYPIRARRAWAEVAGMVRRLRTFPATLGAQERTGVAGQACGRLRIQAMAAAGGADRLRRSCGRGLQPVLRRTQCQHGRLQLLRRQGERQPQVLLKRAADAEPGSGGEPDPDVGGHHRQCRADRRRESAPDGQAAVGPFRLPARQVLRESVPAVCPGSRAARRAGRGAAPSWR